MPPGMAARGRCRSRPASRSSPPTSRRPRPTCCSACRSRAIPSPSSAFATSCSIPRPMLGDYTLPLDPGPRARFGGFTTEGDLAFDAEPCRRARPLRARRALRPPQGRRSARGDGLDPPVQHRLGRAGADRRDAPRTAPNMSTSSSARMPARPRSLDATAGYQHRRGLPARRRLGASQPVPARRRAAHRRDRRHPGAESSASASAATIGASATAPCCSSSRPGRRDYRGLPGLYGPAPRPGHARIDADLAEALDLCLWRRAARHQREPRSATPRISLGDAYLHRRADRPARLRPLEQPARSDPRLPPARPGQSRGLARATAPTSTSAT